MSIYKAQQLNTKLDLETSLHLAKAEVENLYYLEIFQQRKNFLDFFGIKVIENKSELDEMKKRHFSSYNQTYIKSLSDRLRKEMEANNAIIFEDFNYDKIQNPIENLNITLNGNQGDRVFISNYRQMG